MCSCHSSSDQSILLQIGGLGVVPALAGGAFEQPDQAVRTNGEIGRSSTSLKLLRVRYEIFLPALIRRNRCGHIRTAVMRIWHNSSV